MLLELALLQLAFAGILPAILIILAIVAVVFIIFFLGKLIIGLIVNSIVGLIAIFVVNWLFGIGVPINIPVIIVTAIFGLPAVLVIIILRLAGIIP